MIRGATISVKHFLKKNIKPIAESSKNGEMVLKYPLYYYITIKRHTITRVSASGKYFSEEELLRMGEALDISELMGTKR